MDGGAADEFGFRAESAAEGGGEGSFVGSGDSTAGPENMSLAVYSPLLLWPLTISEGAGFSSTSIAIGGSDCGLSNSIEESGFGMSDFSVDRLCDGSSCVLGEGGSSRTSEVKASITAGCDNIGDAGRGSSDCRGEVNRS